MRRLLLALGLAALAITLPSPTEAQTPSFAGTWKLNAKESDDPDEQFSKAMERETDPTAAPGFGRDRRRGPPPVRGAPSGAPAGGGQPAGGRDACSPTAQLRRPAAELVIEQSDSAIILKSGGQCPPGIMYLDSRTTSEPMPAGGVMTSVHAFKDGKLRVERNAGESTHVRETYSLDEKKGKLVAEIQVNTPEMPKALRMKLVYDRQ